MIIIFQDNYPDNIDGVNITSPLKSLDNKFAVSYPEFDNETGKEECLKDYTYTIVNKLPSNWQWIAEEI